MAYRPNERRRRTEETQGIIPRAVAQVFRVAEELQDKGWTYTMEGQFLGIRNHHRPPLSPPPAAGDPPRASTRSTTTSPHTSPPSQTSSPLRSPRPPRAGAELSLRRSDAATLIERSSRSPLAFTLRIRGVQDGASGGEGVRVGTLNLVDLAGSEQLAMLGHGLGASVAGGAGGERLKETQSINRSFSALGDVVAALGSGPRAHVPYWNSKVSDLFAAKFVERELEDAHGAQPVTARRALENESLTSLWFATKVNNTTIGTAKKMQVQNGKA
ncbi:P-loop containing nucleoside triphosphate hydrolase protein [Mycena olivaceomarginata]|nr:P-loop containing nucleoside triphosphate hydrolase protein [Mycena olivaceomarginata]